MQKAYLFIVFWWGMTSSVAAQTMSQWNESIVVDGHLDDWSAEQLVYDDATWLRYSVANDEDYLYLAVRKNKNAGKILAYWGGLMFTVNGEGAHARSGQPWVTFPRPVDGLRRVPESEWTEIEVGNFEGIDEDRLNIYNEYGISVGWTRFRVDGELEDTYCYELAIPLELLGIAGTQAVSFNILLRGFSEHPRTANGISQPEVTMEHVQQIPGLSRDEAHIMLRNLNDINWTELWGAYRLAVKNDETIEE